MHGRRNRPAKGRKRKKEEAEEQAEPSQSNIVPGKEQVVNKAKKEKDEEKIRCKQRRHALKKWQRPNRRVKKAFYS